MNNEFWPNALIKLAHEMPAQQFNTWIRPLTPQFTDDQFLLLAPNRFVMDWVKSKFLPRIQDLANDFFRTNTPIGLQINTQEQLLEPTKTNHISSQKNINNKTEINPLKPSKTHRLNPEFTFDTLVIGKANQLARAAAYSVAENPGKAYNPLFIYGGVGLGKTHLIHAIGNHIHTLTPDARISYIHAENYVTDVVRAYQQKTFDEFKRHYHSLDVLLIDDIQFFGGKSRTQEEFFYAFNALIEAQKQLIITCDTYPKEIADMEDRLKSRFSWGLTVSIEPPELEMRVAILLKKAGHDNINLDENTAFFIAKQVRSNVRELEGALKRVVAFSRFSGKPITIESAKESLKDLLAVQSRQVSIENIQKTVCDYYKIKLIDLYSKKRTRNLVRPRQMAMSLAKELTNLSLPEIGAAFGGRDHTTVLHACKKVCDLKQEDAVFNRDYLVLLQVLTG